MIEFCSAVYCATIEASAALATVPLKVGTNVTPWPLTATIGLSRPDDYLRLRFEFSTDVCPSVRPSVSRPWLKNGNPALEVEPTDQCGGACHQKWSKRPWCRKTSRDRATVTIKRGQEVIRLPIIRR